MRLNYIAYRIKDRNSGKLSWLDLSDFLKAFCKIPDPKLRNIFTNEDDRVFLLHQTDRLFLFVQTNDSKVIEKINTESLELKSIDELLGKNDALGIAAYVYVAETFIGYCAPQLAPKHPAFFRFLNELLGHLGLSGYEVTNEPLLTQGTIGDVKSAYYVSRSSMLIDANGTIGEHIRGALGMTVEDFKTIEGLELVFRPVRGQSIKKIAAAAVGKPGMRKANIRAKMRADDRMLDLYLESSGPIKDEINSAEKEKIYDLIVKKISQNKVLQDKLSELKQNTQVHTDYIGAFRDHHNVNTWAISIPGLQLVKPILPADPAADQ